MNDERMTALLGESARLRLHAGDADDLAISLGLAGQAVRLWPEQPSAWHTLGLIQSTLGRHAEALVSRQRAVALLELLAEEDGLLPEARSRVQHIVRGLASSLLLHGRWKEAWPFWEMSRIGYSWRPWSDLKIWRGEKDGGLLVVPEGGYGDMFMFTRFLPRLSQVYPGAIGLVVPKGLQDFRDWTTLGADAVYEPQDMIPCVYTYSTSIMSLPGLLGYNDPERVPGDWLPGFHKERGERRGTGFCWAAREAGVEPGCRKIRSLDDAAAQAIADGLPSPVYSLIPGAELGGVALLPERIGTWKDTARFVAGLELCVTCDTAVTHIAGLVGTPTLLIVGADTEWRWLLGRDDTPWYPSVRIFRNRDPLVWEVDRILEAVNEARCRAVA